MKISSVHVTVFPWEASADTQLPGAGEHPRSGDLAYLEIKTDEGVTGHSFLGGLDQPASLDVPRLLRWAKPVLIGADPLDRGRIHGALSKIARFIGYRVIGSVDVALWDLAGRAAGLPIHALLGTCKSSLPVYVSSQRFDGPDEYVEQALALQAQGWGGYKIHGPKVPQTDIRIAQEVRAAVGDEWPLFLDGGWSYDYSTAIKIGRALEELDFEWYEDPLTEHDVYGYAKLQRKLDIPLLATEQPAEGLDSYAVWVTERATDMLRGDIPTKGGITAMMKAAHLAEAFGLGYEVHYSGNALCDIAGVHVAMAIPNCRFLESLYPDPIHGFAASAQVEANGDGRMDAPSGPGLGVEVDVERIRRTASEVVS